MKKVKDFKNKFEARRLLAAVSIAVVVQKNIDAALLNLEPEPQVKHQAEKICRWSEIVIGKVLGKKKYTDYEKEIVSKAYQKSETVDKTFKSACSRLNEKVNRYMGCQAVTWFTLYLLCDKALSRGLADKLGCRKEWCYLTTTVRTWAYMTIYQALDNGGGDDYEGMANDVFATIDQIFFVEK